MLRRLHKRGLFGIKRTHRAGELKSWQGNTEEYAAELNRIAPDVKWHTQFCIDHLETDVAAQDKENKEVLWWQSYKGGEEPHPIEVVREFRQAIGVK